MILDYTTFIEDSRAQGPYKSTLPDNEELFYSRRGWCPFCEQDVPCVHKEHVKPNDIISDHINNIWACSNCGWWEQEIHYSDISKLIERLRFAVLRKYDVGEKEIPIETLNKYLKENPDLLYQIHPTKMEQVVQSIFSSFLNCKVYHCGKSHDGGIDLYYIESNSSIAIQVKRRQSKQSVEPVSSIRELLGAALLSEYTKTIFVTTANHFSKEATKAAEIATKLQLVQSFQLFDFDRFVSLLQLHVSNASEPWRKFMPLKW